MPPILALTIWLVLLVALLLFDPAKDPHVSVALWVPIAWMFIVASRLPSQWFGGQLRLAAGTLEEGNPLDRTIFSILILVAMAILVSRSFRWGKFFSQNLALTTFLLFALMSVLWSDFPFVAFKRWFRDLGSYLVILVVLSDARPLEAVRTVLRRLGYLLIPLSILLMKYFPAIGMQYWIWTGAPMYVGPTTSKNMLGVLCLVSGLYFFWDTVARWPDRKTSRTKQILAVNVAFLSMTLWVLHLSDSATSRVCLALGCLVILAAHSRFRERHPGFFKFLVPGCFCLYVILAFGFGLNGELASTVGRNPSLTDRTFLWRVLLNMKTNPLIGTGYESFWLGPRLELVWKQFGGGINEAHNGYLEVYLNLGLIGLLLIGGFLIASYRIICRRLRPFSDLASLSMALWAALVFYNMTEASFKIHLMWVTFLLGAIAVPEFSENLARSAALDRGRLAQFSFGHRSFSKVNASISATKRAEHPKTVRPRNSPGCGTRQPGASKAEAMPPGGNRRSKQVAQNSSRIDEGKDLKEESLNHSRNVRRW
jgi:exopolysaccharide production protein ExoQ